jgi:hypothetical protein
MVEQTTPSTASANQQILYPKVGGLFVMNSAGVEKQIVTTMSQYVGTSGGSANAQTLTPVPAITSYANSVGVMYVFLAGFANTTAMTMAISGLAALNTTMGSVALPVGGLIAGQMYWAIIETATSIRIAPFDAASVNGDTFNGAIIPHQTIGITGTTTNNAAQAGAVGEIITATIATPGTSLVTATPANVIPTPFLSLTAGDWDVWGNINFLPAATTSITQIAFGINSVSATLPAAGSGLVQNTLTAFVPGAIPQCDNVTMRTVSLAATTPYYLVAQAAFTVSTLTVFGTLSARRVR